VCVHILATSYASRIVSARYFIVICVLFGCTVFFSFYLIKGKIYGEKVIQNEVCVLVFSYSFFRSHSKKHLARECHKCTEVFM